MIVQVNSKIKHFFDHPEDCPVVQGIPIHEFRSTFDPLLHLPRKIYYFKDLRLKLTPKSKMKEDLIFKKKLLKLDDEKKREPIRIRLQTYIQKISRYWQEYEFRFSAKSRILTNTLQYTVIHTMVMFGFYSSHLKGKARTIFVLQSLMKGALHSGSFFSFNEALYPFIYKARIEKDLKPMFTFANVLAICPVFLVYQFFEINVLVALRKTLFICAFSMFKDFNIEIQRFFLLNPQHTYSHTRNERDRIRHPFDRNNKYLYRKRTGAQIERDDQQRQKLIADQLASRGGDRIPDTNRAITNPQLYRFPTRQESIDYERYAAKEIQRILDERHVKWLKTSSSTMQLDRQQS